MRSVYEVMDLKCPNLATLVMGQSFIFVPELVRDLNVKLSRLNKLVVLKLMYIANDAMLTNIGALCPRIREMSLKGSSHITDQSAEEIARLGQLSVLDIQVSGPMRRLYFANWPIITGHRDHWPGQPGHH